MRARRGSRLGIESKQCAAGEGCRGSREDRPAPMLAHAEALHVAVEPSQHASDFAPVPSMGARSEAEIGWSPDPET
jgi:hypothetical protein